MSGRHVSPAFSWCGALALRGWERTRLAGAVGRCCFLLLWFLPSATVAQSWHEKSSTHFRVLYQQEAPFAAAVLTYAEAYYRQIRLDLGLTTVVQRDQTPWLWEKRCLIYLYPDQLSYLRGTGAPAWSGGFVQYQQRVIYSFVGVSSFLEHTLPHELAHIMFREFVGLHNPNIPLWLDEGIAQYAEIGRRSERWELMRQWLAQGVYIPFERFNQLRPGHGAGSTAGLFYTQSVSVVHFLLAAYGPRRFLELCSNLRDGYALERALSFATGSSLGSLRALEEAWGAFVLRDG